MAITCISNHNYDMPESGRYCRVLVLTSREGMGSEIELLHASTATTSTLSG